MHTPFRSIVWSQTPRRNPELPWLQYFYKTTPLKATATDALPTPYTGGSTAIHRLFSGVSHLQTHKHILFKKIIMHHGCKSSSMIVYN